MTTPKRIPTAQQRRQIAAKAYAPERTVRCCYLDPAHRKPSTLARVAAAAIDLGYPPPALPEEDAA